MSEAAFSATGVLWIGSNCIGTGQLILNNDDVRWRQEETGPKDEKPAIDFTLTYPQIVIFAVAKLDEVAVDKVTIDKLRKVTGGSCLYAQAVATDSLKALNTAEVVPEEPGAETAGDDATSCPSSSDSDDDERSEIGDEDEFVELRFACSGDILDELFKCLCKKSEAHPDEDNSDSEELDDNNDDDDAEMAA